MFKRFLARLKRGSAHFEKSESGTAAVEFALIALPFLSLVGTIIETGFMFFTEYSLQSAVQNAARLIRTGQAQDSAMTGGAFKAQICNTMSTLVDCNGKVTFYVRSAPTFAQLKAQMPNLNSIGPTYVIGQDFNSSWDCGPPSQPAAVIATYDWKISMPWMSGFTNVDNGTARRLIGFAMFQNEPFPNGSCAAQPPNFHGI